MSIEIDFDALLYSVKDVIDENLQDYYDYETILNSAEIVWDNTAVQVSATNFAMIFDLMTYELLDYTGYDA